MRTVPAGPLRGLRLWLVPELTSGRPLLRGGYEPEVTALLRKSVRPGMLVLVIGAHMGIHALHIGKLLRGRGEVHAFEAWPDNYRWLVANIEANRDRTARVVPVPWAASRQTGRGPMVRGISDGTHRLVEGAGDRVVPAISIDDYLEDQAQARVGLMVIDVEGAELEVLGGSRRTLEEAGPTLVIEHHGEAERLISWLAERGYRTERLGLRHLAATPAGA